MAKASYLRCIARLSCWHLRVSNWSASETLMARSENLSQARMSRRVFSIEVRHNSPEFPRDLSKCQMSVRAQGKFRAAVLLRRNRRERCHCVIAASIRARAASTDALFGPRCALNVHAQARENIQERRFACRNAPRRGVRAHQSSH